MPLAKRCQMPGLRATAYRILRWEVTDIERASVVLFWMPFVIAAEENPALLTGLGRNPWHARGFQGALAAFTLSGLLLNFVHIDPIKALAFTAIAAVGMSFRL